MLQQGLNKIEVIVKKDSGGATIQGAKEKSPETTAQNSEQESSAQGTSTGHSSRRIKRMVLTNITHGLATAKFAALLAINYKIQGLGYETGDAAYQDIVNRDIEKLKDTSNLISGIAMGATYGSWGGVWGAVIGGTLGGIRASTSLYYKYAEREREYSMKVFKQENGIEYMRSRAMLNSTTGRRLR